jgi:hypothetical protein
VLVAGLPAWADRCLASLRSPRGTFDKLPDPPLTTPHDLRGGQLGVEAELLLADDGLVADGDGFGVAYIVDRLRLLEPALGAVQDVGGVVGLP